MSVTVEDYIGPERQLTSGLWHPLTLDETITATVDLLLKAVIEFKRHRTKGNLLEVIHLAQLLQSKGYKLVWIPGRMPVVGAHKEAS